MQEAGPELKCPCSCGSRTQIPSCGVAVYWAQIPWKGSTHVCNDTVVSLQDIQNGTIFCADKFAGRPEVHCHLVKGSQKADVADVAAMQTQVTCVFEEDCSTGARLSGCLPLQACASASGPQQADAARSKSSSICFLAWLRLARPTSTHAGAGPWRGSAPSTGASAEAQHQPLSGRGLGWCLAASRIQQLKVDRLGTARVSKLAVRSGRTFVGCAWR